jgi:hypothetical protein
MRYRNPKTFCKIKNRTKQSLLVVTKRMSHLSKTPPGKGEDVGLNDDILENVSKTGQRATYAVFSWMFMPLMGRAVPPEGVDMRRISEP